MATPGHDAGKKPQAAAAAAGKSAAAAAAAASAAATNAASTVASGTLQLNCAGLLIGDTVARYSWSCSPSMAAAAVAAEVVGCSNNSATSGTAALASCQSFFINDKHQQQQQPGAGQQGLFAHHGMPKESKAVMQPPSGGLDKWLGSAEMHLQVSLGCCLLCSSYRTKL